MNTLALKVFTFTGPYYIFTLRGATLINVKMPTIAGIFTFISMINTTSERLKARHSSFVGILLFMRSQNSILS